MAKQLKRFIVLGLGSFGTALAQRLAKNGCRVTGVDSDEDRVEDLKNVLYEAIVGDVTDRETLKQLLVNQADAVFISLGEQIELSLMSALHCKELGARRIQVKGVTVEHGKILEYLGVERVIFPEAEMAQQLADSMTWPNVLDALTIDTEYSLAEIAVPSSLSGKNLRDADLRRHYGLSVLGVKDHLSGKLTLNPASDFVLTDDQLLLVIGRRDAMNEFQDLK